MAGNDLSELVIGPDRPNSLEVRALLEAYLAFANEHSPPEDIHALDVSGLLAPDVSFFSARGAAERRQRRRTR